MSAAAAAPPAPPAPSAPAGGNAPIPEISSIPAGAQGVRPAPAGTIPAPLKSFSDRPDSAMNKAKDRLRNFANKDANKAKESAAPPKEDDEPTGPDDELGKSPDETPKDDIDELMGETKGEEKGEQKAEAKTDETPKPGDKTKDGKKVNPWNLVKEHKAELAKMKAELETIRSSGLNPEAQKAHTEQLESLTKQNRELLDKIRYVEYQSHPEFVEKYQKPYENQWKNSMNELKGIQIESPEGPRALNADDVLQLVNLPTAEAMQVAEEHFGNMAGFVMSERTKIRDAFNAKQTALDTAKKEGSAKIEQETAAQRQKMGEISKFTKESYEKASKMISDDPRMKEFLNDIDGDSEANTILASGYDLVERAFKTNPMDPSLTPEQRASIVKLHAAVRHRAAAHGRLKLLLTRERAEMKKLKARLSAYESTTPSTESRSNQSGNSPVAASGSKMSQMQQRLRARAVRKP